MTFSFWILCIKSLLDANRTELLHVFNIFSGWLLKLWSAFFCGYTELTYCALWGPWTIRIFPSRKFTYSSRPWALIGFTCFKQNRENRIALWWCSSKWNYYKKLYLLFVIEKPQRVKYRLHSSVTPLKIVCFSENNHERGALKIFRFPSYSWLLWRIYVKSNYLCTNRKTSGKFTPSQIILHFRSWVRSLGYFPLVSVPEKTRDPKKGLKEEKRRK